MSWKLGPDRSIVRCDMHGYGELGHGMEVCVQLGSGWGYNAAKILMATESRRKRLPWFASECGIGSRKAGFTGFLGDTRVSTLAYLSLPPHRSRVDMRLSWQGWAVER